MKESLQRLGGAFIENRDVVKRQFKLEGSLIYPVCANIFCARGIAARAEDLAEGKAILKQWAGAFSNFRGTLTAPISCMLAAGSNPEGRMDQALENYAALKNRFHRSTYLALAAFLLADMGVGQRAGDYIDRGRTLYERMKREHPFLTASEDSVFAVLLAFSEQSDDALIADMEACYTALKRQFSSSNAVQSASHVLALAPGAPEQKAERLIALYQAIRAGGGKYGKTYELATLAALSILDGDVQDMAADVLELDAFLKEQKGYGVFSVDRKTRLMHAAMLAADDRCAADPALSATVLNSAAERAAQQAPQSAALAGTLAMIAAQQAAMCAIMTSAAASSASAANGG